MPGIPGSGGPVPKRSDERRRRNKPADGGTITKAPRVSGDSAIPEADPDWHPLAANWFRSLAESGQSQFYQPSDWATAAYVAESMSRNLSDGRFSAHLFAAVMGAMTELLTTEGARRRARLEIEPLVGEPKPSPGVTAIDEYRRALGS